MDFITEFFYFFCPFIREHAAHFIIQIVQYFVLLFEIFVGGGDSLTDLYNTLNGLVDIVLPVMLARDVSTIGMQGIGRCRLPPLFMILRNFPFAGTDVMNNDL